jgi:hypothetical protein
MDEGVGMQVKEEEEVPTSEVPDGLCVYISTGTMCELEFCAERREV